jgi:hypothetical protein
MEQLNHDPQMDETILSLASISARQEPQSTELANLRLSGGAMHED